MNLRAQTSTRTTKVMKARPWNAAAADRSATAIHVPAAPHLLAVEAAINAIAADGPTSVDLNAGIEARADRAGRTIARRVKHRRLCHRSGSGFCRMRRRSKA